MQDDGDKREGDPGNGARQRRLKLALRENLKRRKSQLRRRSEAAAASSNAEEAAPYDGGAKKPGE
jgi:hypothetical protein